MSRLRVEEVADQVIAVDVALAGTLDRKGKPGPVRVTIGELIPEISTEEEVIGGGPSWPLVGGLVGLLVALLLGGGFAFGLIGGGGQATPTPPPIAVTPTPSLPPPSPTPTPGVATLIPTATASPAALVFPPNTVYDGCIVIDPQGNTTDLRAAFTVFAVQSGDYRASFAQSPSGPLSGSAASGGQNPVVVPMRATRFGVYDMLSITAPDGSVVDLGPLAQHLPLDLNAATDVRNGCDPAKLKAPTQQALAGRAYLQAVAPVNSAAAEFAAATANWTNSTTPVQAEADAAPLLAAFQAVQPQLLVLAAAYPPAAEHLLAANDAVSRLIADLAQLGSLGSIGLDPWLQRYQTDLQALSAASNLVRDDLGVRSIVAP